LQKDGECYWMSQIEQSEVNAFHYRLSQVVGFVEEAYQICDVADCHTCVSSLVTVRRKWESLAREAALGLVVMKVSIAGARSRTALRMSLSRQAPPSLQTGEAPESLQARTEPKRRSMRC
jgi:hypothetical protein